MRLSDLKVGDKFRFLNPSKIASYYDGLIFELVAVRMHAYKEYVAWCPSGFKIFTMEEAEVELITDPPEPQYRPYSDLRPLAGKVVKTKDGLTHIPLGLATKCAIWLSPTENVSAWRLLENFTHLDGTPCGELVEQ